MIAGVTETLLQNLTATSCPLSQLYFVLFNDDYLKRSHLLLILRLSSVFDIKSCAVDFFQFNKFCRYLSNW